MDDVIPPRPDPVPGGGEGEPGERPRPPWRALEAIPVFVLAGVLGALATAGAAAAVRGCGGRFLAGVLAGELAFAVAVIGWVRLVRRAPLSALGRWDRPLRDAAAGGLAGVGLTLLGWVSGLVVVVVARVLTGESPPQPEQIQACVRGSVLLATGFAVVLAAPLGEELFFRGFLYRGLRGRMSVWPAALLSGVLFSVIHVQPVLIFALFPVGVGLAFVYERRGSLVAPIAAHAVFNLIGFLQIASM